MTQPLRLEDIPGGTELHRFSPNDYLYMQLRLREAFATHLVTGANRSGRIFQGNGATRIGSTINRFRDQRTNTSTRSIPGFPGTNDQQVTVNFGQDRTAAPATDFNESPLFWNGTALQRQDQQMLMDQFITPARQEMLTGDMVGTYFVGTQPPSNDGTWENLGIWFNDTFFQGNTAYNLYLRRRAPLPAVRRAVTWDAGTTRMLRQGGNPNNPIYQDLLLPLMIANAPQYRVLEGNRGGSRGFWTDTSRPNTGTSTSAPPPGTDPGARDIYTATSTPTGNPVQREVDSLEIS